jgi:hypothetical protein
MSLSIRKQDEYNQGISKYKLLSATAGVGSIITSPVGTYILVSDINKWQFIHAANQRIEGIRNSPVYPPEDWYQVAKNETLNYIGVELVDDERFIEFLKKDKGLAELLCLAAIPHLSLDERYNRVNADPKDNPVVRRLKEKGVNATADNFTIPGTHFPKWFRNHEGVLREYHTWREEWRMSGKPMALFAPPRDPVNFYPNGRQTKLYASGEAYPEHRELTQLNLILICENGHLSDIPWSYYLRWRTENGPGSNEAVELFAAGRPCCDHQDLKWSESKNKAEGYGSIFLECRNCGMGTADNDKHPKISLEGINNLSPFCPGHKPWEMSLQEGRDELPFDANCCGRNGDRTRMKVALVTGNNVYFANTFSSVYMPMKMLSGLSPEMESALKQCERKYESIKAPDKSKVAWAEKRIDADLLDELGLAIEDKDLFLAQLKDLFLNGSTAGVLDEEGDLHEQFRQQEYRVFTHFEHSKEEGLLFTDIELTGDLATYFRRIKKVEELKVTSVQLDLTRVQPSERILDNDGKIVAGAGKSIFSIPESEVYILPAVENYGEGIFFEFRDEAIVWWMEEYEARLRERIQRLLPREGRFNGNALRQKIARNGAKLLLVHTFSHLMMRELEFTCGYPTASLKERLYVAPDMAGVLIYTAEGSEGSMGGLIWQAKPERMKELLDKALEKAMDCSSDPLCWEMDEGQGVFNLNLAACFSCALVAETACEERNLGLDRRMLIDDEFGFFKSTE